MDFQSAKSFGKLRLRAFQPYHQILCILKHVEMSKIDQIHIRAVMLVCRRCRRWEKNIHTQLITFLIFNGFSIRKKVLERRLRAFQPYHQILCILKHVEKIDQIHIRAVMLCMSKMSKMGKEHTHTFCS